MFLIKAILNPLKLSLIIAVLQLTKFNITAILLKCPLHQMHLQKIVGFRPPNDYLRPENLLKPPLNHNNNNKNNIEQNRYKRDGYTALESSNSHFQQPPQEQQQQQNNTKQHKYEDTTSTKCWRFCNQDNACIAYVHLLNSNECYGYTYFESIPDLMTIVDELPLVADNEAVFYEKTCLKVPENCKNRSWTLTKIPGNSLVFQGKKTITTLVTRRECAERCLFEREFQCLSASFAPSYRNNRERFSRTYQSPAQQHQSTLGRCILSDKDKMIQPDAFRAAPYDEEYMENQCFDRPIENDHCSYELYANSTFIYAELKVIGLNQVECQSLCSHETKFYCQGVSFHYEDDIDRSECLLHSEDIISLGPRSLKLRKSSVYMRRVKCLDVHVICTQDEMIIKYTPKDWFRGKMYVSQHSKDCMIQGNGTKSTLLRLTIGSESKENKCGILRAYEVTKDYQRIFISTLVVIQNNRNVQTQGDRLIKVGCIMSNVTVKESPTVSTRDKNDDEEMDRDQNTSKLEDEIMPNAIALESSLDFSRSFLLNEGSLHYNISDTYHPMPKITLQIIDLGRNHQTNDVQIGQSLELRISEEYTQQQLREFNTLQLPPLPDFRATSLVAHTLDRQNFVQLLDQRGCPTDVSVFPALERQRTNKKNMLKTRFQAFKFAGDSLVNFEVKIHFCPHQCPNDNCLSSSISSLWPALIPEQTVTRKRRQANRNEELMQKFEVQNPVYISTVMDMASSTENENSNNSTEDLETNSMPLTFNLYVRGPDNTNSNSLIYGERGILLIAGIDDQLHFDNICLHQSLLIALLIFWLIIQIALMFSCCYVIQKYKRLAMLDEEKRNIRDSLEYIDSRRVHWADQSGYTF
uniref:Apple domain-containing protein n=1 Tax=Glossina brevipalpis TaxID=37001 RepID=A0A1A9X2J2_9MUSC